MGTITIKRAFRWTDRPLRTCRSTVHHCQLCDSEIVPGERYRAGHSSDHAHEACAQKWMAENAERLREADGFMGEVVSAAREKAKEPKPTSCWVDIEFPGGAYHLCRMSDFRTSNYTIGVGQTVYVDHRDATAHIASDVRHVFRGVVKHMEFATAWTANHNFQRRLKERAAEATS